MTAPREPIVIWGAGAIGGTLGAYWARAGIPVLLVDIVRNRHTAKTHSGIWRDLAVRKRRTEVDPQIGIIARLGAEAGINAPAIRRLVELIHDIEDGRRAQSMETMRLLIETCRSPSLVAQRS